LLRELRIAETFFVFKPQERWRKLKASTMPLIKLSKTNEAGEGAGSVFINTEQIVAVTTGQSTTEIQMADGRTRWVKETPEEVAALVKAAP
jgi:hypothetical protein